MLADSKTLRSFLDRHGLSAKKSLGQHFLASPNVVRAICEAASGCQSVFEIGPGPGILTSELCAAGFDVAALELDQRMAPLLAESAPCATVTFGDALKEDLAVHLRSLRAPRAVVSNLPYYITGPLLTRIAEANAEFDRAILMMQREVGQKIVAPLKNSDRGSISVFMQLQFEISKVCDAPAGAFMPPPNVESIVLKFTSKPLSFSDELASAVFRIVRAGFKQPRKTLVNNMLAAEVCDRLEMEAFLKQHEIDAKIRPQFVADDLWIAIAAEFGPQFMSKLDEALPIGDSF